MNIFINGESFSFSSLEVTVQSALQQFLNNEQQQTTYAVAVNSEFVGRGAYSSTLVNQGDSIDVLFPIQGG